MDTLQARLAELADDAPTGGSTPAELWARGKRAHRLRMATIAATVLVVGAVGAGVAIADDDGKGPDVAPAGPVDISLPIEYPVGEKLLDLGETPGPLAAVWVVPRPSEGAAEVVGLVAETGGFGTLPIDIEVWPDPDPHIPDSYASVTLSPDGRRIAYVSSDGELIVRDLVNGESRPSDFEFGVRGYDWVDATHLLGRVAEGSDADGWLWEPGSSPELVDFYLVPYGESGLAVPIDGGGPRECWSPTVQDLEIRHQAGELDDWAGAFEVPMLCDILGITDAETLLGHRQDADDGSRTVVALDISGIDIECPPRERCVLPFDDSTLGHVVVTARGPERVWLATDLIAQALDATGGAS
jgi:hypothetical protein